MAHPTFARILPSGTTPLAVIGNMVTSAAVFAALSFGGFMLSEQRTERLVDALAAEPATTPGRIAAPCNVGDVAAARSATHNL